MDKLQLAMLTQWAEDARLGGIQGRKRMQKVIYFLQQAGCPIKAEFILHNYGPYSREVANVTDVMVAEHLLEERNGANGQYDYRLSPQTRPMIGPSCVRRGDWVQHFEKYKDQAVQLLKEDLWTLELGSTILYFYRSQREPDWNSALREACKYKRADVNHANSQAALELAKRLVPTA